MEQNNTVTLEKIAALSKRRGFVYPTSEIYGGLTSSYDYGPLGAELLRNIRNLWWHEMITTREDMVGIDSQILLHPETWVASGHVTAFNDPLVEDKVTHKRYRADHLIEQWLDKHPEVERIQVDGMGLDEIGAYIEEHHVTTPEGNEVFPPKAFNIMFQTAIGVVEGEKMPVYLRGETAQGIFTNFNNIINSTRIQLPFGVGQIGKSFRNEITTGQFIFRTLEFEQAEIEYFFDPEKTEWEPLFKSWQDAMYHFVNKTLGINADKLRWRRHSDPSTPRIPMILSMNSRSASRNCGASLTGPIMTCSSTSIIPARTFPIRIRRIISTNLSRTSLNRRWVSTVCC